MTTTCPNCSAHLEKSFQYCPSCGQTTHLHRFNLAHIGHEIFHAFTHADKGVFFLLKELAIRPGVVAREYVMEGKRKKYFNPFTFLLLALGVTLFINSVFHPYTGKEAGHSSGVTQQVQSTQARKLPPEIAERKANVDRFFEKRTNLVNFFVIPLFALIYWLFFLRSGINYAEHLVAMVFFAGFYSLLTLALLAPLKPYFPNNNAYGGLQLLLQFLYLSFAYYQFLGPGRKWRLVQASLVTLIALFAWSVLSYGLIYIYMRYGG